MTTFLFGDVAIKRGAWMGYHKTRTAPLSVAFSCPACGAFGHLDVLSIRADGGVSAITVCPKDCGWAHAGIVLEKWKPTAS